MWCSSTKLYHHGNSCPTEHNIYGNLLSGTLVQGCTAAQTLQMNCMCLGFFFLAAQAVTLKINSSTECTDCWNVLFTEAVLPFFFHISHVSPWHVPSWLKKVAHDWLSLRRRMKSTERPTRWQITAIMRPQSLFHSPLASFSFKCVCSADGKTRSLNSNWSLSSTVSEQILALTFGSFIDTV